LWHSGSIWGTRVDARATSTMCSSARRTATAARTLASAPGRYNARGRQQTTPETSSPPCEALWVLLVSGTTATEEIDVAALGFLGARATVWVAPRVRGKGGTVGSGTINRPREAALACGPQEERRGMVRGRTRARIRLGWRSGRDDRWVPPVSGCVRGAPNRPSWAG
jgi:hypothetical protein